jgi:hypothetical protein
MTPMDEMTDDQKAECLALAEMMERVKKFPGGVWFVGSLLLAVADRAGLALVSDEQFTRVWAQDEQRGRHKAEEDRMSARSEVERAAQLVEAMIWERPWKDKQWARCALGIAARSIRRGRHLTYAEKMDNLRRAFAEESITALHTSAKHPAASDDRSEPKPSQAKP